MDKIGLLSYFIFGLFCLKNLSSAYDPSTCIKCRESHMCKPPECFCCRDVMPMETHKIPQMVFFSFDDAVTPPVAKYYKTLFDGKRLNPNGCPISMTLFISHSNTVYKLVKEFYNKGMEIASHSVTHSHPSSLTFMKEAKKQRENLAREADIPESKITGWRSPFLEPLGDIQPAVLKKLGYEYDATLTISKKHADDKAVTPFTLDYGWPYDCKIKQCPKSSHTGFWEVPVVSVKDYQKKYDCVYVDGCSIPPPNQKMAYKFLMDNFNSYYTTNRAPMGINMHASWFYYPDRMAAMDQFIKDLVKMDDVYIVSIKQVIEWMKNPTPLHKLKSFSPWQCNGGNTTMTNSAALLNPVQQRRQLIKDRLELQRQERQRQQKRLAERRQKWRQQQRRIQNQNILASQTFTRLSVSPSLAPRREPTAPWNVQQRFIPPGTNDDVPPLVPNLPMLRFWWQTPRGIQRRLQRGRQSQLQQRPPQQQRQSSLGPQRLENERLLQIEQRKQLQEQARLIEQQRQEELKQQALANKNQKVIQQRKQQEIQRQELIKQNEIKRRQELKQQNDLKRQKMLELLKQQQLEKQRQQLLKQQEIVRQKDATRKQEIKRQIEFKRQKALAIKERELEKQRQELIKQQQNERQRELDRQQELKRQQEIERQNQQELLKQQEIEKQRIERLRVQELERQQELRKQRELELLKQQQLDQQTQERVRQEQIHQNRLLEEERILEIERQRLLELRQQKIEEEKALERGRLQRLKEYEQSRQQDIENKRIADQHRAIEIKRQEEHKQQSMLSSQQTVIETQNIHSGNIQQEVIASKQIVGPTVAEIRLDQMLNFEHNQRLRQLEQLSLPELKKLQSALQARLKAQRDSSVKKRKQVINSQIGRAVSNRNELIQQNKIPIHSQASTLPQEIYPSEQMLLSEYHDVPGVKRTKITEKVNQHQTIASHIPTDISNDYQSLDNEMGHNFIPETTTNALLKQSAVQYQNAGPEAEMFALQPMHEVITQMITTKQDNIFNLETTTFSTLGAIPDSGFLAESSRIFNERIQTTTPVPTTTTTETTTMPTTTTLPTTTTATTTTLPTTTTTLPRTTTATTTTTTPTTTTPTTTTPKTTTPTTVPTPTTTIAPTTTTTTSTAPPTTRREIQPTWSVNLFDLNNLRGPWQHQSRSEITKSDNVPAPSEANTFSARTFNDPKPIEKKSIAVNFFDPGNFEISQKLIPNSKVVDQANTNSPTPPPIPVRYATSEFKYTDSRQVTPKRLANHVNLWNPHTWFKSTPRGSQTRHETDAPVIIPTTTTTTTTQRPATTSRTIKQQETITVPRKPAASRNNMFMQIPSLYGFNNQGQISNTKASAYQSQNTSRGPKIQGSSLCKQGVNCIAPTCRCKSENAPKGLKPNETPQMVYITIDGSLNYHTYRRMVELFSKTRKNPNGCPVKGTVFVTDSGSSYSISDSLSSEGVEIGMMGMNSRAYATPDQLRSDLLKQRERISKSSNITLTDIKGWRSPGFKPLGDKQYDILQNHGLYDSSLIIDRNAKNHRKPWPFTLDFGWTEMCEIETCPTRPHPGVWEIPIVPFTGPDNTSACEYTDGCAKQPRSEKETMKYLMNHFNNYYQANRAPFAIRLKQIWFHWYYRDSLRGLVKFLDTILGFGDVYVTSINDMLEWMKNPTKLQDIRNFEPWKC